MSKPKKRMNIATSCNDRYARLIFINLISIHEILTETQDVHFYLMHSQISEQNMNGLKEFSEGLNLTFHSIHVAEREIFDTISR